MESFKITLRNPEGLHSRPVTHFITTTNFFKCRIRLESGGRDVNAKSLLGVLSLGLIGGKDIKVIFDGQDEIEACKAVERLIELFNEGNNDATADYVQELKQMYDD